MVSGMSLSILPGHAVLAVPLLAVDVHRHAGGGQHAGEVVPLVVVERRLGSGGDLAVRTLEQARRDALRALDLPLPAAGVGLPLLGDVPEALLGAVAQLDRERAVARLEVDVVGHLDDALGRGRVLLGRTARPAVRGGALLDHAGLHARGVDRGVVVAGAAVDHDGGPGRLVHPEQRGGARRDVGRDRARRLGRRRDDAGGHQGQGRECRQDGAGSAHGSCSSRRPRSGGVVTRPVEGPVGCHARYGLPRPKEGWFVRSAPE